MFDFRSSIRISRPFGGRAESTRKADLQGFEPVEYAGHEIEPVFRRPTCCWSSARRNSTEPFGDACRDGSTRDKWSSSARLLRRGVGVQTGRPTAA